MNRRIRFDDPSSGFDDDAQVDGDDSGTARFVSNLRSAGIPWAREGLPPWHLWGTQETVVAQSGVMFTPAVVASQQLTRVAYKRPDTWHWLFFARLLEGPSPGPGQGASLVINFDVTIGLGRSNVQLVGFETFSWSWGTGDSPPTSVVMFSSTSRGSLRTFPPPATPVDNLISELVAQDVQVNARIQNGSNFVSSIRCEVASFFAPKSHIRPDWYSDGPLEVQFTGAENQGK
jgi:hypothetical protein